jgi:hypothetical protein
MTQDLSVERPMEARTGRENQRTYNYNLTNNDPLY